jgi:hypothetical protein
MAHLNGAYGRRGVIEIIGLAPRVERLLTTAQKATIAALQVEQDQLCAAITGVTRPREQLPPKLRSYRVAALLVAPGAVEVYDQLLETADRKPAETAP